MHTGQFACSLARPTSQERGMGVLERAGNDTGIVNLPELPRVREPLLGPGPHENLQRFRVACQ